MIPEVAKAAEAVEAIINKEGMCLTMGGEPTFIPERPQGAEWNNAAMGPQKLGYARRLAGRFLQMLYPGGLVMQIFGKQYPNEPLPRWVMLSLARKDGEVLWSEPKRLLLDDAEGRNKPARAKAVMAAIAEELGFPEHVLPCREKGFKGARGYVLPLDFEDGEWISEAWPWTARKAVPLFAGDSPVGLRLPLGDLPEKAMRRALTVEVTKGVLKIFIPPLTWEGFNLLIAVCRNVAKRLRLRDIVFCGYRPYETGGQMADIGCAADPGVLEINLPPTANWDDYKKLIEQVSAAAGAEGLQTLKLHLNGAVHGSGGGSHMIFGGPSLEENPFLKRPVIIARMIRYWQHHPALAYFFTGQYVGPGSQAPRADETLTAKLYELETACIGVEAVEGWTDKAYLDRLFRNLMTDSAGNTHRAEICLDKFQNLGAPNGELGLVELRAFETVPEASQQALVVLFIRAIIARLMQESFTEPLVRFGAKRNDTYMLPHGLWHDLENICADLNAHGIPFQLDWLRPIFEFRFPVLGTIELPSGTVVLRQALEPWPLMAEVADAGFTSRVVDNSTDRVELSVSDPKLLDDFAVTVNGYALAFREHGDTFAAGIRYKCANGWPALHPHIPNQSPIRLECVEKTTGKCVGGADYYYWNPEAAVYDGAPANVEEALKRRKARWKPYTPSEEKRTLKKPTYSEENFDTLDLRRHF